MRKREESVLLSDIDSEYLRGLRASTETTLRQVIGVGSARGYGYPVFGGSLPGGR